MAGAEQNSVTSRVEGEGVHLVCMVAVGGSVSKDLMLFVKCFDKYSGTHFHPFFLTFKTKL